MIRIAFFLLVFLTNPTFSEEANHSAPPQTGTENTGKRLAAEGKLSAEAVKFLSSHFFRSEEIIRKDFETKLPAAIEKALQNKDETEISELLAPLLTSISPKQAEVVIKDATQEIKTETDGKDPGKFDTRYVALMERLLWAAMNRNGELPKSEKAKDFNNAFKEPYTKARDFAKLANEKSKQAAEGNKEAKKWVDENIRKDTVLSIAEGLRKTGAKDQGNNLIRGQAMDLGNGQKALDMWGQGKEPQRLYLGPSPQTATQAIDKFLEEKKTFGTNVTARRELPNNKNLKSWFINESGKFTKGAPKGFEPKEETAPPPPPPGGGGTPPANTDITQLNSAIESGDCKRCHALEIRGTSLLDAEIVNGSQTVKLADFPTRFNNPNDPMFGPMKQNPAREMFEQFAQVQRGAR